jgi:hypothetical protein
MIILSILCIRWWLVYACCLQVNWEWVLSTNLLLFAHFLYVIIQSLLYLLTAWLFFEWKCLINNTVNFMQVKNCLTLLKSFYGERNCYSKWGKLNVAPTYIHAYEHKDNKARWFYLTRVEAGLNTSTVTLRVVGGDEKGSLESETVKYGH